MNKFIEPHKDWIDKTWDKIDKKLKVIAPRTDKRGIIPYTAKGGLHTPIYATDEQGNTMASGVDFCGLCILIQATKCIKIVPAHRKNF